MRGVADLIAAILLIAIVIVIGTIITVWGTKFFEVTTTETAGCVGFTSYIIESQEFNTTGQNELRVKITNFGKQDLYGFGAILRNSSDVAIFEAEDVDQGFISEEAPLKRGESAYILIIMDSNAALAQSLTEITVTNQACFDVAPILPVYQS